MLVLILFFILYCSLEGYEHARYITIYHYRAALRRIALGVVITYCICGIGAPLVLYLDVALMIASVFWVTFDIAYNLSTGRPIFYIGSTAAWDIRLNEIPVTTWVVKFVLVGLSVGVYYFATSAYSIHIEPLINTTWIF